MSTYRALTLLEVDYSRILVLTTKEDYLEFENKYCLKKLMKPDWKPKRKTRIRRSFNQNGGSKKSLKKSPGSKLVCVFRIDWPNVKKKYDGIALVPNPTPYFPRDPRFLRDHLWLRTYDVSSLVIWNHQPTASNKPITKHVRVGDITEMVKEAGYKDSTTNEIMDIDNTARARMKKVEKFYNIVIKNI